MCGLLGIAGDGITTDDLKMFKTLMSISSLRGLDGTGLLQAKVTKSLKPTFLIEKDAMESNAFLKHHLNGTGNKLVLKSILDNVFIGHTRWATRGDVNKENCHPFKFNNIVGVHNGTLTDGRYHYKDVTDSELLIEDFSNKGIKKTLSDLDATNAFAVVVLNLATGRLTFARNHHRELHLCFHKHRRVLYWASEEEMLEFALKRHGIQHEEILIFKPNHIYSINPWDIVPGRDGPWQVEEFTPKSVVFGKKKKKFDYHDIASWNDWGEFEHWQQTLDKEANLERSVNKKAEESAKVFTEKKGDDLSKDEIPFKNSKIPPRENCGFCGTSLNLAEQFFAKEVTHNGKKTIQCADCSYAISNGTKIEDVTRSMLT